VEWPITIEASSLHSVTEYVINEHGAGVTVFLPELVKHPKVRVLPLEGWEMMEVAAVWRGEGSSLLRAVLDECQRYAREMWPETAGAQKTK
jgi:hypothetical protein